MKIVLSCPKIKLHNAIHISAQNCTTKFTMVAHSSNPNFHYR